jgi:hypothetical protein
MRRGQGNAREREGVRGIEEISLPLCYVILIFV